MKKQIIGNWKMNGSLAQLKSFTKDVRAGLSSHKAAEMGLAVPFPYLSEAVNQAQDYFKIGAQNCSDQLSGALTGEVSVPMIKDIGAAFVLVGHSERRSLFAETSGIVSAKARMASEQGLCPVVCVGESETERVRGEQESVIARQLDESLAGLLEEDQFEDRDFMVAYEPVWAIGTGKTASAQDIADMHHFIRQHLIGLFGTDKTGRIALLYGGSVKPANAGEILTTKDVDGVLVGGASLKAEDFLNIYDAAP